MDAPLWDISKNRIVEHISLPNHGCGMCVFHARVDKKENQMNKRIISYIFLLISLLFASGCSLKVVDVNAPAVNCIFDTSCTVTVNDTTDTIPIPAGGTNFFQSRTFTGKSGAPANGLYAYEYRIDLRNAIGITYIPCIKSLTVEFGTVVSTLDYDGDGEADQVYVITSGGLGSVSLASAQRNGDNITFNFTSPVCAGGSPGTGQSSFFFGLVSTHPPQNVTATVMGTAGDIYDVQARAAGM